MHEKYRQFVRLAREAQRICDTDASWETKYDLIFSEDISTRMRDILDVEYYDPDTSYQEDVRAFCAAMTAKADDLERALDAAEPPRSRLSAQLGPDGKAKVVYDEGAPVWVTLEAGVRVEGVIRGMATENVVDFWIVEFVDGPPHPDQYPWSCASVPHVLLAER
jgi:hypothetical protein